jgi:F-type H+-transporting ATPase subunit k
MRWEHHSNSLQLAMATLATTFGVPYLLTRGGSAKKSTTPPLNAGSKDEEKFIQ